jgi:hypothetical protein
VESANALLTVVAGVANAEVFDNVVAVIVLLTVSVGVTYVAVFNNALTVNA